MIKNTILFDLDGTITQPEEGITKSLQYALSSFGINIEDRRELRPLIGPALKKGFMEFFGFDSPDADKAVAKYRERYSDIGIFECEVYDGVIPLLERLKAQGKTIFIATSKPAVYAKRILQHFKLDRFFSFVGGSELSGERVEKDEVISHVLQQTGFSDKTTAVMVGDRKHDLIGAQKNGLDSVGVLYGYGSREELSAHNPLCIVDSVKALEEFLCGK